LEQSLTHNHIYILLFFLDDANLLVLIIDTNQMIWARSAKSTGLSLKEALRHLLVFINAHLALKHDNEVAVIASDVGVR